MDTQPLRELHLFAGAGGGILGGFLLGHRPVCAVEIDPYCQRVLMARQRDGILPSFPIWDDVRTFDGYPWQGHVDVLCGGFPCQDISSAGKRQGISGARSGLWAEYARLIGEIRPRYVFIENVAALAIRGLNRVLADLATLGLDARWCCLGADDVGAPHIRKRLWILAYCPSGRMERQSVSTQGEASMGHPKRCCEEIPDAAQQQMGIARQSWQYKDVGNHNPKRLSGPKSEPSKERPETGASIGACTPSTSGWELEPDVGRVAHGVASRLDRLKALGNGQVPLVAAAAWHILQGP